MSVANRFHRMPGLCHKFSRFFEKDPAFLSQGHAPLIAQKEGNTKVLFQLSNLAAQGRLRDVQLLRRFAEVKALRNRDKVPNMTKFHGQLFYTLWGYVFEVLSGSRHHKQRWPNKASSPL